MTNDTNSTFDGQMDAFLERMTETYMNALDQNLDAQSAFLESWMDSMEDSLSEERVREGYEGSMRAYEAWMDAAETSFERMGQSFQGEDVEPEEFRDIWLSSANEAFKEMMTTTAFAAATGQTIDEAMDMRQNIDEASEETLHALNFATVGDVREVGERLVELERRQHTIEQKLDRIIDEL
ncbi:poly(R)-hydroxyalkanoic acid synthase subunit PhaE [Haloplanus halobius]|uniref:poly(R)-hydroxyalkanoic acid synthase subunit PhaE n=1 Tax=Haloplanus halobius TaxID=2934938 RepID=UPI00200FE4E7|nr:poly(R)-hydroxyalkanoic acid synthase subunit PhaE [Haloplanus sp. XH21]